MESLCASHVSSLGGVQGVDHAQKDFKKAETKTKIGAFSNLCCALAQLLGLTVSTAREEMKNKGTFRESWDWVD